MEDVWGDEVILAPSMAAASHVLEPASIVEHPAVGRIEVGLPKASEISHVPAEVLARNPLAIAVIEVGGGVAFTLGSDSEPGTLASVPGLPDDVADGPTYVMWTPLPDQVHVVVFRSGRHTAWQRPLDRIAAFPWPTGFSAEFSLAGFDTDGARVAGCGDRWPI